MNIGIQPDILVCAKGLTSGYLPLGATLFSDGVHEAISAPGNDAWFTHGFTYSGHPVCCAAALENIRIIEEEGLLGQCPDGRRLFRGTAEGARRRCRIVGDVRGRRLMMCVEYVADKATREPFPRRPTSRGGSPSAARPWDCWSARSVTWTSCRRR